MICRARPPAVLGALRTFWLKNAEHQKLSLSPCKKRRRLTKEEMKEKDKKNGDRVKER